MVTLRPWQESLPSTFHKPHSTVWTISTPPVSTLARVYHVVAALKLEKCIIDDDMAPLYEKIDAADRIFFVSPVYFYAMSAQIKTFIDRCQALWSRRYLLGKRHPQKAHRTGHLLSCAATGGDQIFTGSTLTIKMPL